jgi:hypothetical protein
MGLAALDADLIDTQVVERCCEEAWLSCTPPSNRIQTVGKW